MKKPYILGIKSDHLLFKEKKILAQFQPFGIILFKRNILHKRQLKKLIKEIKSICPHIIIFLDEEGGIVNRIKFEKNLEFLNNQDLLNIYQKNKKDGRNLVNIKSLITSYYLRSYGIHSNTVPVLDLPDQKTPSMITRRTFGSDVKTVFELNKIIIRNNLKFSLLPIAKHIPGHGYVSEDSHLILPKCNKSLVQLSDQIKVFKQFNYLPFAMTAHILFKEIDPKNMATFSKKIINSIIRKKIGFKNLLMTDDIQMSAISMSPEVILKNFNYLDIDLLLNCGFNCEEHEYYCSNFSKNNIRIYRTSFDFTRIPKINLNQIINYRKIYDKLLKKHGFF